ncbi:hypothetical protein D9757_007270 [Collybiopsis confluens]|uniref:DUF7330 domain-containing protein n=1 Tax=Collybiopsis confluens TaxID=2823264 RepID=A0A8H5HGK9_9AGAR|nr:hypothetical protein D9757_007270 [Collybiopsis confluens]
MKNPVAIPLHSGELLLSSLQYTKHVKSFPKPQTELISPPPSNPPLEPTNFVSIIRGFQPIHEYLIIDPSLDIPFSQRPPLTQTERTGSDRNSVNLKVNNAEIVADIQIVSATVKDTPRLREQRTAASPAKLYVRSDVGDITVRMHREEEAGASSASNGQAIRQRRPFRSTGSRARGTPVKLSIRAGWGDVFVSIPRNYYGPLRITSKGVIKISPVLVNGPLRTVKQSSCGMLYKTRECFVGKELNLDLNLVEEEEEEEERDEDDLRPSAFDAAIPDNDEIVIEAKGGCVYLQYDDEGLKSD